MDREALERSDAISPTFMDRVNLPCQQCAGPPERLLAEIDTLPRFRDFLEREGYLDLREPVDDVCIRTDLLVALAPDVRAGHCTVKDVEQMLEMGRAER